MYIQFFFQWRFRYCITSFDIEMYEKYEKAEWKMGNS